MEKVHVNTEAKKYSVYIGDGIVDQLPEVIQSQVPDCGKILIITDSNVAPLYLNKVKGLLDGFSVNEWVVPAGETSKSMRELEKGITYALRCELDRHALIIALGGGVVGDLAGFIAATYLRGIRFLQIPTTLLAHDSSVGGKVGVNHTYGKNLIGAFHQPEAVIYDVQFLNTLPAKEWRSGFAEVVKLAFIRDATFYDFLFEKVRSLPVNKEILITIVKRAIEMKAAIVSEDEKEAGIRAYLNFGHTLGHAIEAESRYQSITHGEAVMIGMIFALRLSEVHSHQPIIPKGFLAWIHQLGYANWHATLNKSNLLLETMKKDKKNKKDKIRMVLLKECGSATVSAVENQLLIDQLSTFKEWLKVNEKHFI
ncbi:3-dehydroquinate synthase [Pseudalkalibacillus berkeleyi]|uniref:3-dehydroquinate synthase n=1 Tax=Pseudalkalibacillus berkeleyi TaxID=1069813 RepID=A0ABS9H1C9_9BACL|nr:3-dehydroquinate synthase [Pseudalkalibacillus berkeleyi]MCF6137573.1 3-dehydroquinate synthase [Pseudalkalibacillus berkeleyi]